MRRAVLWLVVAAACAAGWIARGRPEPAPVVVAPAADPHPEPDFAREPLWAYGVTTAPKAGDTAPAQALPTRNLRPNEDADAQTRPRRLPGSAASFSLVDIRDGSHVVDWFPAAHPPMPSVVQFGSPALGPAARGCASCHLPNGRGRPENAPVAGLPMAYFLRQIQDFRTGARHSADPRKPNVPTMITLAVAMSDAELAEAAAYFTSVPYDTPWIRVVESTTAPVTRIVNNLFIPVTPAATEPLGTRVVEVPADETASELLRDPRSGFVAYVPPGALARGRVLVETGGLTVSGTTVTPGRVAACVTCHGRDLRGVADVPPIAGRSPSYLARQIWDIQQGTRRGTGVALMKAAVAGLSAADLVDVVAYVAAQPVR